MSEILLTYFEPFGNRDTNASKEVALSFSNQFKLFELEVNWINVVKQIDNLEEPKYLFMIGEAGKYQNITIELQANNIANGIDNQDNYKNEEKIMADGPNSINTNINFDDYKGPASKSNDAGKYLCNYSYYHALHKYKNAKIVFIHVPYIDDNINSINQLHIKLMGIISYVIGQDLVIKKYDYCPDEAKVIRHNIFIKEQGFTKEFDEIDYISTHFLASLNDTPIATCRLFYDEDKKAYHLGRIAVKNEYRKIGIGSKLIDAVIAYLLNINQHEVILGAQVAVKNFYEKCGFVSYGEIFYDEYSPHIMMKKVF